MSESFKAFVDRIEGDKAVLLVGEGEIETIIIPTKYLPSGAGEGTFVTFSIATDEASTEEARARIRDILQRLSNAGPESKG